MTTKAPVVFVHGLWLHATGWGNWLDMFRSAGYDSIAPGYPGDGATVQETRSDPERLAGLSINDLTAAYTKEIAALPAKPIVIGHSLGGLIAQKLLAQGTAAAAVAISPGQIRGVRRIPLVQLRSGSAALSRPGNRDRAISLNAGSSASASATRCPRRSRRIFSTAGPSGRGARRSKSPRPTSTAPPLPPSTPGSTTAARRCSSPAARTSIVPPAVARAASGLYAASRATTDYHEFPGRGHSMVLDHGWRDVAEYSLSWLERQGF